jgi:hypothetical protein
MLSGSYFAPNARQKPLIMPSVGGEPVLASLTCTPLSQVMA